MTTMFGALANGLSTIRHTVSLLALAAAGVVSVTLLYAQVAATDRDAQDNTTKIEKLETALSGIQTQQQVIINEIENERRNNKEFRDRTDRSLNRILERLPLARGLRK